jgi:hypothetical protein
VGLAISEGKLNLDDEVLTFFPEQAPSEPSWQLKAMRVHDLLRMSTGHQSEPPRPADEVWTKAFLAHPVPFKPGTHFLYNTSGTYMLSAIVQKVTGQTVLDYLRPRLFQPLGIEDPSWKVSPEGITTGGYGLSVRTEAIAGLGQLYLQQGRWQGKQLVPASWVAAATTRQTANGSNPNSDWDQGYGYQFWRCRNGAYRGDGAFGQYCIVLPNQDAVIAITSGVGDMQSVLNLVWDKLLPALKEGTLARNDAARRKLERRLKSLSLPLPPDAGPGASVRGLGKTYRFPLNPRKLESIMLERRDSDEGVTLVTRVDGVEGRIACGQGAWLAQRTAWGRFAEQPVAVGAAWTEADTFTAKLCFYETPHIVTIRLKFVGPELHFDAKTNVGFGRTTDAPIIGLADEGSH